MQPHYFDVFRIAQAFQQAAMAFQEALAPAMQHMLTFLQQLHAAGWQAYRNAGMPYGETEAGMQRWLEEDMQARRLAADAERIREHHAMLADFWQQVTRRKEQP